MNRIEEDVGKDLVQKLIEMTRANTIVWTPCIYNFHAHYRYISFKIIFEDRTLKLAVGYSMYYVSWIKSEAVAELLEVVKKQLKTLSDEERGVIQGEILNKSHLEVVLEILGQ